MSDAGRIRDAARTIRAMPDLMFAVAQDDPCEWRDLTVAEKAGVARLFGPVADLADAIADEQEANGSPG